MWEMINLKMETRKQKLYREAQKFLLVFQKEFAFPLTKSCAILLEKHPWLLDSYKSAERDFLLLPIPEASSTEKRNIKASCGKSVRECYKIVGKVCREFYAAQKHQEMPKWLTWYKNESFFVFFEAFFQQVHHVDSAILSRVTSVLPKNVQSYQQDFERYKHIESLSVFSKENYRTLCDLHAMLKANVKFL